MANGQVKDPVLAEMERILAGEAKVKAPAAPPVQGPRGSAATAPEPAVKWDGKDKPVQVQGKEPAWLKKSRLPVKTTVRRCIVIDKDDHWHQEAQVDLKGVDATEFTWGYYGQLLPVLVEQKDQPGLLKPFHLPDAAGENSNRLFKAANPDGFRARFRRKSPLLQKIQVGLMVALVLGLFFIMFILINNK